MNDGVSDEQPYERRNANRGYRNLRVWQVAVRYYAVTCRVFRAFRYALRRIASNQMASVDSIHRNIAEGYCRRTASEYLRFLNIALSSTGESVSGLHACRAADQISAEDFDEADGLAYEVENRLARLVERVAEQRDDGQWNEDFSVREDEAPYGEASNG